MGRYQELGREAWGRFLFNKGWQGCVNKGGGHRIVHRNASLSHTVAQIARRSTCGVQLTDFQRTIPFRLGHREIGGGGKGGGAGGGVGEVGVCGKKPERIF